MLVSVTIPVAEDVRQCHVAIGLIMGLHAGRLLATCSAAVGSCFVDDYDLMSCRLIVLLTTG